MRTGRLENDTATILLVPSTVMSPFVSATYCTNAPSDSSLSSPTPPISTSTATTVKFVVQVADAESPSALLAVALTFRSSARNFVLAAAEFVMPYVTFCSLVAPTNWHLPQLVQLYVALVGSGSIRAVAFVTAQFDSPASVRSSPR